MEFLIARAGRGDCLLIQYGEGEKHRILIDSGAASFAPYYQELVRSLDRADIICLTHIDADHIGGMARFLSVHDAPLPQQVWLAYDQMKNAGRDDRNTCLSVQQANRVMQQLNQIGCIPIRPLPGECRWIGEGKFEFLGPSNTRMERLTALSDEPGRPNRTLGSQSDWHMPISSLRGRYAPPDQSVTNAASLIFLFTYNRTSILFTGDATPDALSEGICESSIERHIDYIKLPHHGSLHNTSLSWLKHIRCRRFIISADGRHFPDKQTIATLLDYADGDPIFIYTNYAWWRDGFLLAEDQSDYIKKGLIIFNDVGGQAWKLA